MEICIGKQYQKINNTDLLAKLCDDFFFLLNKFINLYKDIEIYWNLEKIRKTNKQNKTHNNPPNRANPTKSSSDARKFRARAHHSRFQRAPKRRRRELERLRRNPWCFPVHSCAPAPAPAPACTARSPLRTIAHDPGRAGVDRPR